MWWEATTTLPYLATLGEAEESGFQDLGVFRCAKISWLHVGESVSHSVINFLRFCWILGISRVYHRHISGIYISWACLGLFLGITRAYYELIFRHIFRRIFWHIFRHILRHIFRHIFSHIFRLSSGISSGISRVAELGSLSSGAKMAMKIWTDIFSLLGLTKQFSSLWQCLSPPSVSLCLLRAWANAEEYLY